MIFSPVLDVALERLVAMLKELRLEAVARDVEQAMGTFDWDTTRHALGRHDRYVEDLFFVARRSSTYGPDQDEHRRRAMVASRASVAMKWLRGALSEETEEAADGLAAEALGLLVYGEERALIAAALAWREGEPSDAENVVALVTAANAYRAAIEGR
jgi:hypothetical protein